MSRHRPSFRRISGRAGANPADEGGFLGVFPDERQAMEHDIGATEVQINSELVTNPGEREDLIYALSLVLLRAAGHPLHPVLTRRDRIAVQAPREALEEAATIECPERVEAGQIAFFDPRV
jgi:hypothetical protein